MDYSPSSSVIVFGTAQEYKRAALFFHNIAPVDDFLFHAAGERSFVDVDGSGNAVYADEEIPREIIDPRFLATWHGDEWEHVMLLLTGAIARSTSRSAVVDQTRTSDDLDDAGYAEFGRQLAELQHLSRHFQRNSDVRRILFPFFEKIGAGSLPLFHPSDDAPEARADQPETLDQVCVTLSGLPLIQTTEASWDQVLEFRKDKDAARRLTRLRLFLAKEFEGKPRSYIRDQLHETIRQYEDKARKHGFILVDGILSEICSSRNLVPVVASIYGIISNNAALTTAGGTLEIGKVALTIRRYLRERQEELSASPVSYIMSARLALARPKWWEFWR